MLNKNIMIIDKGAEQMSEPRIYYVVLLFYFLLMSRDLMVNVVIFHEYVFSVVLSFLSSFPEMYETSK